MTFLLLGLLVAELALMVAWGLWKRERTIQFPFLTAVGFAGYLLPQLFALTHDASLPNGALDKTIVMSMLCLAAAHWGYVCNRKPAQLFQHWEYHHHRLVIGSVATSAVGAYFFYQVSQLQAEVSLEHGTQWTGIITIYAFFAQLLTVGFIIALTLLLKRPSWTTALIVLFGLVLYFDRIVFHGRRGSMVELFLAVVLSLWFQFRWAPPRWSVLAGVAGATLMVNAIVVYRQTMLERDHTTWTGAGLSEVLAIDYWGIFSQSFTDGGTDMRNALYLIEGVDQSISFDYGLWLWDALVRRFVPGQIIGHDTKEAMQFNFTADHFQRFAYTPRTGTTMTGIADSFSAFWYFGAVKFLVIGFIISRFYKAAEEGNLGAQLFVVLTGYSAMQIFTFSTHSFVLGAVDFLLFVVPVMYFARRGRESQSRRLRPRASTLH